MRGIIISDLGLRTTERFLCDAVTWEACGEGPRLGTEGQVDFRPEEPSEEGIPDGAQWSKKAKSHISYVSSFLHLLTSGAAFLLEENG